MGKGSAGLVYKAYHKKLMRDVAVKSINIYEKEKRRQLLNDLKSLTAMSNANDQGILTIPCDFLVNFYGGYLEEGNVKVVLEFMDKGSLKDLIKKRVRVSEPMLCVIAAQILNGLAYLHTVAKQAHLDIKPDNILLNSQGYVKLSDFGISKGFEESQLYMKTFIGTTNYMSPERIMVVCASPEPKLQQVQRHLELRRDRLRSPHRPHALRRPQKLCGDLPVLQKQRGLRTELPRGLQRRLQRLRAAVSGQRREAAADCDRPAGTFR